MRTHRAARARLIAALIVVSWLLAVPLAARAQDAGEDAGQLRTVRTVVVAITATRLTADAGAFPILESTALQDQGGQKVALAEIQPGTPVELDLDEAGRLVTVRATLVR